MTLNKLLIGIFLLSGFNVYAQKRLARVGLYAQSQNTVSQSPALTLNRDSAVRSANKFVVNGSFGNIAGGIPGGGIEGMYRKDSKIEYGFEAYSGSLSLIDRISTVSTVNLEAADLKAKYFGGSARYFFGETFAITGGLGYRQIDSLIRVTSKTSAIQTTSNGEAFYARVGIGNYWSWSSGFSLGCEWIGAQVPLSSKYSSANQSTGVSSSSMEDVRSTGEELGETLAKSTILQTLNLKIGYTF